MAIKLIEHSQISPPPATVGPRSLRLTFFDTTWLLFPPVHHLFFYQFPHPKSHFTQTLLPNLKHSLSLTLQHFFPFAGNLIVFNNPDDVIRKPEIRHAEGDSVALTIAECDLDFDHLTGDQGDAISFIPPVKRSDYVTVPLFSIQITVFPGSGFAIGMTNHHSLGDASTRFGFLKAWALIACSGGEQSVLANGYLPIFERLIDIPKLDENKLRHTRVESFYQPPTLVRATFVLARTSIDRLKERVKTRMPSLEYMSSFTVTCGYIWSCIAKSLVKTGERKGVDELEHFIVTIDCRSRLDPPVPANYFGNCTAPCIITIESVVLSGEKGFEVAVKLIGEGISKMVNDEDGILKDAERWHDGFKVPGKKIGIAGTPKLNFYDIDFGCGKPRKHETVSIDYNGSISINAGKESTQDLEIGLCLSSVQMEAFADIFNDGIGNGILSQTPFRLEASLPCVSPSVLGTLVVVYLFSLYMYKALKEVVKKLESMRILSWGSNDNKTRIPCVISDIVLNSKEKGGLGYKMLLCSLSGGGGFNRKKELFGEMLSWPFTVTLVTLTVTVPERKGSTWLKIVNGYNTRFWSEVWCDNIPLADRSHA
ncbi:hypothetical protein OSB04_021899 [Centaurea solstitialis]|uniref:Uncharacterized protein n=1 Tax=Centaurea solstitialis TaxID=347529 RepID=A0AA38T6C8_9ASTR|nr:hypothetical protein OSB04_021899 [Centaurea solstitialis]